MKTRFRFARCAAFAASLAFAAAPAFAVSAVCLAAALFAGNVRADYVTQIKSNAAGTSSFTGGSYWSDGEAPSSGKDYMTTITAEGEWTRTPTTASSTFPGRSLTVGDPASQATGGKLLLVNTTSTTINDLRLAGNAQVRFNTTGDTSLIGTSATVVADNGHPAVILIGRAPNANTWNCVFRGAAGTRVRVENYNYPSKEEAKFLTDTGAASREFAGILEIGDHVFYQPGHWVRVPSLCLNGEGARFECTFVNPSFELAYGKADGRDIDYRIEVGTKGGTWYVSSNEGRTRIDWPVTGSGTLNVTGSGGVLAFEGSFSETVSLDIAETGAVALTNGVSFASGNAVSLNGGTLHLSADATPAPGAFSTTGGTIVLYPDAATGATVPLKARTAAALSGVVKVALAASPATMPEDGLLPFLAVPEDTDLSGVFFDWTGVGYGQPVGGIAVSEPANGFVTVSVKLSTLDGPVTQTVTGTGTATLFEKATHWSDGLTHHGTNYLVRNAWRLQAKDASYVTPSWSCKAASVTLAGSTVLMNKQSTKLFFQDLRLYDSVKHQLGGCEAGNVTDERQEISGDITIATATRGYAGIRFSQGSAAHRWGVVNANLHGAGNLLLGVEGTGAVDWQLRGDNSSFHGSIEVYPASAARLGVDLMSATALGGNPPEFLQHGFLVANAGVNVTNVSVAVADANRGVTISNATVNVDANLGFSIASQTLLGGTVAKTGGGTWTLSGASAPASDATLSVTAGTLAFAAENAAAGVALSFAAGAALGVVAPEFSARGVVLTNGLSSAGATLPVRIVASNSLPSDTFRLAVFTAPAATVDALLPALSGSATSGKSAAVSFSAGPAFDLGGVSVKTVSASVAPAAFVLIVR